MKYKLDERELSLGRIMYYSFKIFSKNFFLIGAVILIISIPISIVNAIINIEQWNIFSALVEREEYLSLLNNYGTTSTENLYESMIPLVEKLLPVVKKSGTLFLVSVLISLFFKPLCKMGIAFITGQDCFGIKVSLNSALEKTFAYWGRMSISTLIYSVAIFISCNIFLLLAYLFSNFILILIPIISLSVTFNFYSIAIILSNKGEINCLRYSAFLIQKRWLKSFLFLSVFTFLNYLIYFCISMAFLSFDASFLLFFIQDIIAMLLGAYFYVCNAVWYINLEYIKNGGVYFDKSA